MEAKAYVRFLRMAPRKVRLVTELVKGLPVGVALAQLAVLPKAAARPVRKVIESAVANAVHNNQLDREKLFVQSITADGGPVLKRFRPRAFGKAATIRKRTTHISVVVSDIPKAEKAEEAVIEKPSAEKNLNVKDKAPKGAV
jgi:large subunit ribosomal protein L22